MSRPSWQTSQFLRTPVSGNHTNNSRHNHTLVEYSSSEEFSSDSDNVSNEEQKSEEDSTMIRHPSHSHTLRSQWERQPLTSFVTGRSSSISNASKSTLSSSFVPRRGPGKGQSSEAKENLPEWLYPARSRIDDEIAKSAAKSHRIFNITMCVLCTLTRMCFCYLIGISYENSPLLTLRHFSFQDHSVVCVITTMVVFLSHLWYLCLFANTLRFCEVSVFTQILEENGSELITFRVNPNYKHDYFTKSWLCPTFRDLYNEKQISNSENNNNNNSNIHYVFRLRFFYKNDDNLAYYSQCMIFILMIIVSFPVTFLFPAMNYLASLFTGRWLISQQCNSNFNLNNDNDDGYYDSNVSNDDDPSIKSNNNHYNDPISGQMNFPLYQYNLVEYLKSINVLFFMDINNNHDSCYLSGRRLFFSYSQITNSLDTGNIESNERSIGTNKRKLSDELDASVTNNNSVFDGSTTVPIGFLSGRPKRATYMKVMRNNHNKKETHQSYPNHHHHHSHHNNKHNYPGFLDHRFDDNCYDPSQPDFFICNYIVIYMASFDGFMLETFINGVITLNVIYATVNVNEYNDFPHAFFQFALGCSYLCLFAFLYGFQFSHGLTGLFELDLMYSYWIIFCLMSDLSMTICWLLSALIRHGWLFQIGLFNHNNDNNPDWVFFHLMIYIVIPLIIIVAFCLLLNERKNEDCLRWSTLANCTNLRRLTRFLYDPSTAPGYGSSTEKKRSDLFCDLCEVLCEPARLLGVWLFWMVMVGIIFFSFVTCIQCSSVVIFLNYILHNKWDLNKPNERTKWRRVFAWVMAEEEDNDGVHMDDSDERQSKNMDDSSSDLITNKKYVSGRRDRKGTEDGVELTVKNNSSIMKQSCQSYSKKILRLLMLPKNPMNDQRLLRRVVTTNYLITDISVDMDLIQHVSSNLHRIFSLDTVTGFRRRFREQRQRMMMTSHNSDDDDDDRQKQRIKKQEDSNDKLWSRFSDECPFTWSELRDVTSAKDQIEISMNKILQSCMVPIQEWREWWADYQTLKVLHLPDFNDKCVRLLSLMMRLMEYSLRTFALCVIVPLFVMSGLLVRISLPMIHLWCQSMYVFYYYYDSDDYNNNNNNPNHHFKDKPWHCTTQHTRWDLASPNLHMSLFSVFTIVSLSLVIILSMRVFRLHWAIWHLAPGLRPLWLTTRVEASTIVDRCEEFFNFHSCFAEVERCLLQTLPDLNPDLIHEIVSFLPIDLSLVRRLRAEEIAGLKKESVEQAWEEYRRDIDDEMAQLYAQSVQGYSNANQREGSLLINKYAEKPEENEDEHRPLVVAPVPFDISVDNPLI